MTDTDVAPVPLKTFGVVAVGAVLLAAAGVFVATNRWSTGGGGGETVAGLHTVQAGELETMRTIQDKVRREAEASVRLDRTLAVGRADSLLEGVSTTRATVEAAKSAYSEWGNVVPPLMTSQAGMRIAANPAHVQTFDAIYRRAARPGETVVTAIERRLHVLEAELRTVKESQDALLSEEGAARLREQLEREQLAAGRALDGVAGDLKSVKALVATASASSPAAQTLQEALDALAREQAEKRAKLIAAEVARVSEEQNELDKQMEGRKAEEIRVAERQQREADLEAERMRKETRALITERNMEQERREILAKSPEVQANYSPLLTKGKTRPSNNNPGGPGTMTWGDAGKLEAQHVSLTDVQRTNALNSFEDFVRLMTSTANDRGCWPPHGGNEKIAAEYRRRFEEFKDLAPLWIEMGLLRK